LVASITITYFAYACLEDIGFYAREDWGALLGLPGIIACMIISGNYHAAYPKMLFPPVNFVCDVMLLVLIRKLIVKVRARG
jgi:hypothetical protein